VVVTEQGMFVWETVEDVANEIAALAESELVIGGIVVVVASAGVVEVECAGEESTVVSHSWQGSMFCADPR
jgi:superfamily I DNA and RNA helicase